MSELVSILMPLYNSEKWVADSIRSVINQTHKNWELIIVDDGSTDLSNSIAEKFRSSDERIHLYKQENLGADAARNFAYTKSKGNFIQYLDADDLLSENKIKQQLRLLGTEQNRSVANCSYVKFRKDLTEVSPVKSILKKNYSEPINWLLDAWSSRQHNQTACWLVPRSIIEEVGPWNEQLKINQDGEFFCRVLLKASDLKFDGESIVYYRMDNPKSISRRKKSLSMAKSLLYSYFLYEKHLEHEMDKESVRKAILKNYFSFLTRFDRYYPKLSPQVWSRIEIIGAKEFADVSKSSLSMNKRLLGFKNYLTLARMQTLLKQKTKLNNNLPKINSTEIINYQVKPVFD